MMSGKVRAATTSCRLVPLVLALILVPLIGACRQPDTHPTRTSPSVILVIVDTLGVDFVGSYGGEATLTPAIDRIAREGVQFDARSVAPWTVPSVMSVLTSTYPSEHGHGSRLRSRESVKTLAAQLREAGYATAAFVDFAVQDMADGFEVYRSFVGDPSFPDRTTTDLAPLPFEHALEWVKLQGAKPFFVFIHTSEAHDYIFAKPYQRAAADREHPDYDGPVLEWSKTPVDADRLYRDLLAEPANLSYARSLHKAGVRAVDQAIDTFDRGLHTAGLWSDVALFLTSDHGEGFDFERRRVLHGGRLHEDLLQVPLIVRWPSRLAPTPSSEVVSLLDVMPTVLQVADAAVPPGTRGLSLLAETASAQVPVPVGSPAMRLAPLPRRDFLAEESVYHVRQDGYRELNEIHQFALYSARTKFILSSEDARLYDLEHDPLEATDVFHLEPRLGAAMHAELGRFIRTFGPANQVPSTEVLNVLRSLGYVR